jgi:6-phosphogluconolactonase
MKLEVFADSDTIAREAVKLIAKGAREAVRARGSYVMAVSGGKTRWLMFVISHGKKCHGTLCM